MSRDPESDCRLCKHPALEPFLNLERSPQQIARLVSGEELQSDKAVPLSVFQCRQCGFVQLIGAGTAPDYDDYELSWMHIKTLVDYRTQLAAEFVSQWSLAEKSVLDIGCGSGDFMNCLAAQGAVVSGIEPSAVLAQRARDNGFPVDIGLVGDGTLGHDQYDGISCLQVLEHVPNPVSFLTEIRQSLTPQGKALIEVPRLEISLDEHRFYDFFGDHLNYFSNVTLRLACELAGLEVFETRSALEDQFLIAIAAPNPQLQASDFQDAVDLLLNEVRSWFAQQSSAGKSVAIWGAGYKSNATITAVNPSNVQYVVDSDPAKHGRYTPGSHLPICAPATIHSQPVDAILIAAAAYKHEILHQLRNEFGFTGAVVALGKTLQSL